MQHILQEIQRKLQSNDAQQIAQGIEDGFDFVVESVSERMRKARLLFVPPYAAFEYIYIGHSESLDAWKIGVSSNVEKRSKGINRALVGLGFKADFVIIDYIIGPQSIVRKLESAAKNQDLSHLRIGTSEWFKGEGEPMDWFFEASYAVRLEHEKWLENQSASDHKKRVPQLFLFGDEFTRLKNLTEATKAWGEIKPIAAYEDPRRLEFVDA